MASPPEPEEQSTHPEPGSFAERLKEKHGTGIDPGVSLNAAPEETTATSDLVRRLAGHAPKGSRYRFESEVARGGMGAILRVWDEDIRRHLAMKVILGRGETATSGGTPRVDPSQLARFLEEAQITGQLDHPGIVPVHELGLDSDGRVYFTMKLVKGRDLKAIFELVFADHEGWNETRALSAILKACEAVAYAHAKGVIHRDLKPGNVMVGNFGEVYVMDWGLARVLGKQDAHDIRLAPEFSHSLSSVRTERREEREELADSPVVTMDGDVVGTPAYMAPEQACGEIEKLGPRSDVYAMGAMLYHLLARQMPYLPPGTRLSARTVLSRVIDGPPAPLDSIRAGLPAELVAIVERAMAREPAQRYADTLALAEDLRAYLEDRVVSAYETGTWAETRKWIQRNKGLAAALAAVVLVLAGGGVALMTTNSIIRQRNAELAEATGKAQESERRALDGTREARANLYVAAITAAQAARSQNEPASVRRLLDSAPEELRNWEWGYLDAASNTSLYALDGRAPAFSPDGGRILTVGADDVVRVWDVKDGELISSLAGHGAVVNAASFSPDGRRIVTASDDMSARVWDATTGQSLMRIDGHTKAVCNATFSPNGARILTASHDDTARVWDATSGTQLAQLAASSNIRRPYAYFTPEGSRIITSPVDEFVQVWNASDFSAQARLRVGPNHLFSASSLDGERIVTADGLTPRVWEAARGLELHQLREHRTSLESAQFSLDGTRITTTALDKTCVWETSSGKKLLQINGHTKPVMSASFSPDGFFLLTASGDATACVWDVVTGKQMTRLEGHTGPLQSARFSPDGSLIATEAAGGGVLVWDAACIWDTTRFQVLGQDPRAAAFSPDGCIVATAPGDNTAALWDVFSSERLFMLVGHSGIVKAIAFDPEGARLATLSEEGLVRLWDVTTGKQIGVIGDITNRPTSLAFSHDGSRIVTALDGPAVGVWDSKSGQELVHIAGHSAAVVCASFSPDDERILTGSSDGTVRVWDSTSGRMLAQLRGQTGGLEQAAFSPDGAHVLTRSSFIARVWNSVDGAQIATLEGHTGPITCGAFSPDGVLIATGSADWSVRVWDVASGSEVSRCEGHVGPLSAVSFSPDSSRMVTSSVDGTARVWNVRSGAECQRLGGDVGRLESASFSPDGTRVLTVPYVGAIVLWDSVPTRIRVREQRALRAAHDDGQRVVQEILHRSAGFVAAVAEVRRDPTLKPLVRRTALEVLGERVRGAMRQIESAQGKRRECEWLERLVGRKPWPNESEVEAALAGELGEGSNFMEWNNRAWELVRLDAAPSGDEVRGMLLARRAVALASPDQSAVIRDTIAKALYRLGRFDEALTEQRLAVSEAPADRVEEFEGYVRQLMSDVARWRDDSGSLRTEEIGRQLQTLEQEIEAIERDPDVVLWSSEGRR